MTAMAAAQHSFPRLYAILDAGLCHERGIEVPEFAAALIGAGCTLIQYRNKQGSARQMLADALALRSLAPLGVLLIMNDRADICLAARFDGVHLGQDDLSISAARKICPPPMILGTSTHNYAQLEVADSESLDYIAIGPVFATASKENPDPVVGLEGVRSARKLTDKPLVAIGGITSESCRTVIDAGADAVAIISALTPEQGTADVTRETEKRVQAFLRVLG